MEKAKKISVLFVCLGNICRSPAAQAVFQALVDRQGLTSSFIVDSAGTYGGHAGQLADPRMRRAAAARGYRLTHHARQVTRHDLHSFDLIAGMDSANLRTLRAMATREQAGKIIDLGRFIAHHPGHTVVPDPYYGNERDFELALDLIEDACAQLLSTIVSSPNIINKSL